MAQNRDTDVGGDRGANVFVIGGTLTAQPDLIEVTPAISTSIYAAGDVLGGELTITGAVAATGGKAVLQSLVVVDRDNEKAEFSILLFRSNPAANVADNGAFAWGSGDQDRYIGRIDVLAGDYKTLGGDAFATLRNLGLVVESDTTDLYAYLVLDGTPTFAATNDVTLKFGFLR
jgi:hypothetical protein